MSVKSNYILIKLICFNFVFQFINCSDFRSQQYSSTGQVDYSGSQVFRVVPINYEQLDFLFSLEDNPMVKFWQPPTNLDNPVDILVAASYIDDLELGFIKYGIVSTLMIKDVGHKIARDEIQSYATVDTDFFSKFRRYDEIKNFLIEKHNENKKISELMTIGKSVENRPIVGIKIGLNLGAKNKQIIYIDGGMHAREWAAVTTACYIIDSLITDHENGDKNVDSILNKFEFYIVPVINPDGYEFTHTDDRMWRKNRAIFPNSECMGTDLNRNYAFHWGGEGSSRDPCQETYAGPKAFSEPESTAVSRLILQNKDRMLAYITLHAYGQYFLYPWGWNYQNSPNLKELKRVANIGYRALHAMYGTVYKVGSPGQIMYVSQGSDDWAHGQAQIPYVYTLEMRDLGKHGFLLPKSDIVPVGKETYAAVKAVAAAISNVRKRPGSNISEQRTVKKQSKTVFVKA